MISVPDVMLAGLSGEAVRVGKALTGKGGLSEGQESMNGAASV